LDRYRHPIADARDSEDNGGIVLPQGSAQFGYSGGERTLHDGDTRPGGLQQFLLGDHLAGVEEQLMEHFEGFGFQLDHDTVRAQLAAGFIEFEMCKAPDTAGNFPFLPAIHVERHGLMFL
jgi:hypothetical protein